MKRGGEFDLAASPIPPGLSVIEASAGTGKTFSIAHLVPRLLAEGVAEHLGQILLVTFTKDAARELADRTRETLAALAREPSADDGPGVRALRGAFPGIGAAARRALLDVDRLQVSTIHSFCQRVLQTEGTLCGLPAIPELVADAGRAMDDVLRDVWEGVIGSDATLAGMALAGDWDFGQDHAVALKALWYPDAPFLPKPAPLEQELEAFRDLRARCGEGMVQELREAWVGMPRRNKSCPDEAAFEALCEELLRGTDARFLKAAEKVTGAEGWANRRDANGKAAVARLAACGAVSLARDAVAFPARVRWAFRHRCAEAVRERVPRALAASRQITYDGIIEAVLAGLRGPQGGALRQRLRESYRVAIIDESQDTDPRQFALFQAIFAGAPHRLLLIGDPKQAIYGFREADVNTYLRARDGADGGVYHLTRTFRQPRPLVEALNTFFARPGSFLKEGLGFHPGVSGLAEDRILRLGGAPVPGRVEAWVAADWQEKEFSNAGKRNKRIAAAVASEIVRLLGGGAEIATLAEDGTCAEAKPVRPGHFAVLVATHWQADAIRAALSERGVPAVRARTGDVMKSEEAAEILSVFRAIAEPCRTLLRNTALATRMLGFDAGALRELDENAGRGDAVLEQFLGWRATLERDGIVAALARVDAETGATSRLAAGPDGERRITNLRHLTELLGAASREVTGDWPHLLRWYSQQIARDPDGTAAEEREQRLETDAEAVQIVTMHSAKGLEYHLVFCPFLQSIRQPSGVVKLPGPDGEPRLVDLGLAKDFEREAEREAIEDRLRLAYVAMTRARTRLWIGCCPTRSRIAGAAVDWLLRPDAAEYETAPWRKAGAASHGAVLDQFARSLPDASWIILRDYPEPSPAKWNPPTPPDRPPLEAAPVPQVRTPWSVTSFSALTREKHPLGSSETDAPGPAAPGSFAAAAGGALAGTAVHEWIERWDFAGPDPVALERHCAAYGLRPDAAGTPFHSAALPMLRDLAGVVLPGLGATVAEACARPEASEWHFQLPVAEGFGAAMIASAYAHHGFGDYAAAIAELPAEALEGFLHGFIDRIAFHGGCWGVVDWKTNRLESYAPAALDACIQRSHYLLQSHLYLVALRRFLGPEPPIAGAWVVFLRGIRAGTSEGVAHVPANEKLLAALDTLFTKPAAP